MEDLAQFLVLGVPIAVIIPLLVEQAKMRGMATSWSGVASMVIAFGLVMLTAAAGQTFDVGQIANYLLQGIVYGLFANGVYSQAKLLRPGSV